MPLNFRDLPAPPPDPDAHAGDRRTPVSFATSAQRTPKPPRSTPAQREYLEILLNDCGYTTRARRNAFLSGQVERDVTYIYELTVIEASACIDELKDQKRAAGYL